MNFREAPRKKNKTNTGRIRLDYYGIDYIARILKSGRRRLEVPKSLLPNNYKGAHPPMVNLHRMELFFLKGMICPHCDLKGAYFALDIQRNGSSLHMDLYGIDHEGDEVMMTRDHIFPRSKGGIDHISNLQPMCKVCNEFKSNKIEFTESDIDNEKFNKVEIFTALQELVTVKYIDKPIMKGHKLWFERAADKETILEKFGTTSFNVLDVGHSLTNNDSTEQGISVIVEPIKTEKAL